MKIKMKQGLLGVTCIFGAIFGFSHVWANKSLPQSIAKTNFQTVVFKDASDTLIPIEVDFKRDMELDLKCRNMIEVMKSRDYEYLGLYPILDANLQVNALSLGNKTLTLDLSDHLYVENDREALDIFEMLAYVFCVDGIEKVNLKINGNDVIALPDSTIFASCITSRLGINNFDSATNYLYKTTPVVVYNTKMVNNQEYYVPVTKRVEATSSDLDSTVSLMLEALDCNESLQLEQPCVVKNGRLEIHLKADILNDNESIDNVLYHRIVKSACHLDNVHEVALYVDQQEIEPVEDVNGEVDNRIKI